MTFRVRVRRTIAAVLVTAAIGALGTASASSLGGLAPFGLLSTNAALTSGTPTVLGCDDFSRAAATGSALVNRPVQLPAKCGNATWTAHTGTWTITAGQLGAITAGATASIVAGQISASAQATVLNANGTGRTAGVAIDHTGATRTFLAAVVTGGNTLSLQLSTAGVISSLSTIAVTLGVTNVVRITRNGTAVTVSLDGNVRISFTLTAGQVTTLAAGTRAGLYWNAGSTVRFSNFLVTTASTP